MNQPHLKRITWFFIAVILYVLILAYYFTGAFREPHDYYKLGPDGMEHTCIIQWGLSNLNRTADFAITEAPIYYPCPHGRFYSEHLFGHLVFAWPLSFFIKSPVSLLAALYMLNLFIIGIATYLLCLELTRSPTAALINGAFLMIGNNFIQFNDTTFGWGILVIFFFIRHFKAQKWSDIVGLVICGIFAGLGSLYTCLYTPVAIFILLTTHLVYLRVVPSRKWFLQMIVAFVFLSAVLSPTMLMYKKVQDEFTFRRTNYCGDVCVNHWWFNRKPEIGP